MKIKFLLLSILFFLLLILPCVAAAAPKTESEISQSDNSSSLEIDSSPTDSGKPSQESEEKLSCFRILDESSGKILEVSDREFYYGAIVTEMPPTWSEEALKAQAVAAYTYYSRLRAQQEAKPSESLKGAHFTANTENWLVYVTREQMESRFGKQSEEYFEILDRIIDEVYGQTLQYQGELALSVYHAISSGNTEACSEVWGGDIDYLIPVSSPGDIFAEGYETVKELSSDQVKNALQQRWPQVQLNDDPKTWFSNWTFTASGSVHTVDCGDITLDGEDLRIAFGLRSSHFETFYQDGIFQFTVQGYGHGVGMSQTGAAYMAEQGSTYQEILNWYYPGTTLQSVYYSSDS